MKKEEALKVAKPILFNTQMVRAITKGAGANFKYYKTYTRRIMKPQPPNVLDENSQRYSRSRYNIGDILYVRETWCQIKDIPLWQQYHRGKNRKTEITPEEYVYKADNIPTKGIIIPKIKWHPSIHMPKEAARIFLRITQVRVERLQNMDGLDALYEGVNTFVHPQAIYFDRAQREAFAKLWDSTIKKEELDQYGWEANPWVWVYKFERVEVEP